MSVRLNFRNSELKYYLDWFMNLICGFQMLKIVLYLQENDPLQEYDLV